MRRVHRGPVSSAQSKIDVGMNGASDGTMPPRNSGATKMASPIAPTAAWFETRVAAVRLIGDGQGPRDRHEGHRHDRHAREVGHSVQEDDEPCRRCKRDDNRREPEQDRRRQPLADKDARPRHGLGDGPGKRACLALRDDRLIDAKMAAMRKNWVPSAMSTLSIGFKVERRWQRFAAARRARSRESRR